MAEEFLNRANIMATFKQVGGKGMTKAVRGGGLADFCLQHGAENRFSHKAWIEMMPTLLSCLVIPPALVLGEYPLPDPLLVRIPVFTSERPRELQTSVPLSKVFLVQALHLP